MFYGRKDKSYLNHWSDWAIEGREKEELFQQVRQLVIDMIAEILPQELEKYMNSFSIDVRTQLNGREASMSGLKSDLERLIMDELTK